jgi:hypothetical protein
MTRPSAAQIEMARRWLVDEGGAGGTSEACATAAGRIHDRLTAQLAPLLGAAGVQALFVRSGKLAQAELASAAEGASLEGSTKLAAHLRALDPLTAMETAVALFARFLELVTTFIGERLTIQALKRAWPRIDEKASPETKK